MENKDNNTAKNSNDFYTLLATDAVLKLRKLKCFFGFHNLIRFKHCDKYLVAAYCKNCGIIKVGNPIHYDGTFYQRTLKPKKALDFIDSEIKYVQSVIDRRNDYKKWCKDENYIVKMIMGDEIEILCNYETTPNLITIKNHIKSKM